MGDTTVLMRSGQVNPTGGQGARRKIREEDQDASQQRRPSSQQMAQGPGNQKREQIEVNSRRGQPRSETIIQASGSQERQKSEGDSRRPQPAPMKERGTAEEDPMRGGSCVKVKNGGGPRPEKPPTNNPK